MKPLKLQYRSELIAQLKEEESQIAQETAEKYVYNKLRFFLFFVFARGYNGILFLQIFNMEATLESFHFFKIELISLLYCCTL